MISKVQYLGAFAKSKDVTPTVHANIDILLSKVNKLIAVAVADGVIFRTNPETKSQVSGQTYGGFREQCCTIGAPKSAHKIGQAVDLYDPYNAIDNWLISSPIAKLEYEALGLWFEHPLATQGWSHWSTVKPKSGNRFFKP